MAAIRQCTRKKSHTQRQGWLELSATVVVVVVVVLTVELMTCLWRYVITECN